MVKISAVIPAFNEENRIESVLKKTQRFVDEIIVVDDIVNANILACQSSAIGVFNAASVRKITIN